MKKILFLVIAVLAVVGCSKSDEESSSKTQDIWINGYKALTPSSIYENVSTTFLLFSNLSVNNSNLKSYNFNGDINDYQKIKDETWDLLNEGKIKLENGSVVNADYKIYASSNKDTYTITNVKTGSYLMIAIYEDSKSGYLWLYSQKYACKNVEITDSYNPPAFTVVFPCDLKHYGKIEWVNWEQNPYPYDFDFN